jgi:hypothetical protein
MRKTTVAASKVTLSTLTKDLQELITKEKHFQDIQAAHKNNPSVKPMIDSSAGRLDLAEALLSHIKGNSLQLNILLGR